MNDNELDIIKVISYSGTMDVLFAICKGKTKFTDIMFETELNPSILDRILKTLIATGLLSKDRDGYHLSEKGRKIALYTLQILEIEHDDDRYSEMIRILSGMAEQTVPA